MSCKTVLIVGNFAFPRGNAAGKRVLGLGYLFSLIGYNAVFSGCQANRSTDMIISTRQRYDDFTYYNFNGSRGIKDICNVGGAFDEFKQIVNEIGNQNVALIILYGSPVLAVWIRKVISFGKRNHIPVVFDCVDWIEKSGFESGLKNLIKYIDTNYMKRILACKCDGVISISRYLYDYYKGRGCNTILIPPVGKMEYDAADRKEENTSNCVRFVYAGSITLGKTIDKESLKDRIDLTIEIMNKLHRRGLCFEFNIFGIDREQYVIAFPEHEDIIKDLESKVFFHGKTPNEVICNYIREADYTILNRVITKVTTAGFPSKISESLLMGTPVISNATSDITDYIKNGENGLIISFDTDEATDEVYTLCRDMETARNMKSNCCEDCCFDVNKYKNKMNKFIKDLQANESNNSIYTAN